jgi:hypothetical protein
MKPDEFVPFGASVVVAIAKKQRKEGKTITQKVGWTGACVGYGELTGHGGALRIYNPEKRAVKVVSRNLCTINMNAFYWKEKKKEGWTDLESPADWILTPEAMLDPEEFLKYGFDEEVIADLAVDLSHDAEAASNPDEAEPTTSGEIQKLPEWGTGVKGEEVKEEGPDGVPKLEEDPMLKANAKGRIPEIVAASVPLAQKPLEEGNRRSTRLQEGKTQKPPKSLKQKKPLKENQGYIDKIIGEELVDGNEHIVVHWEGFAPGNDTSSMAKSHAKRFPVLRGMLKEFEQAKAVGEPGLLLSVDKIDKPGRVDAEEAAINLSAVDKNKLMSAKDFLGNSGGNDRTRRYVPSLTAC